MKKFRCNFLSVNKFYREYLKCSNPFNKLKMFTFRPQAFFKTMNLRYYSHIFSSSITHCQWSPKHPWIVFVSHNAVIPRNCTDDAAPPDLGWRHRCYDVIQRNACVVSKSRGAASSVQFRGITALWLTKTIHGCFGLHWQWVIEEEKMWL